MRCIRPGVPGIAHGRASVSGSRRYGQYTGLPSASVWLNSVANGTEMSGSVVDVGQPPRLGAVGQVAVGQQDHRCAVLERDAGRLDRGEEAVRRAVGGHDRQRRLAVAAVHRDVEVGRLGLGGQAGRRAAALDVDDEQRQLEARPPERWSRSSAPPRAAGGGDAEVAGERGAERHARRGDLVLGLQVRTPKCLCFDSSWRMSDAGRDRVRAEVTGSFASWPAATSPQASAVLPVMLVYSPAAGRRADLVAVTRRARRLAEVVAGQERRTVRAATCSFLPKRCSIQSRVGSIGRCTSTTPDRARRSSSTARRRGASRRAARRPPW
jgi:hypothetical protein